MSLDIQTKKMISDPKRRRAWVKYRLDCQGLTLADVGREAGVERQTLYQVFHVPYPRIERVLAQSVGLTAQELFPERYRADGSRIRKKPGPKPKKKPTTKHSKKRAGRNVERRTRTGHQEAA